MPSNRELKEMTLEKLHTVALEREYKINNDEERVEKIVSLMTRNLKEAGDFYCPCKMTQRPPVAGIDTLCPCPELDEEVEELGSCRCRIFYAS